MTKGRVAISLRFARWDGEEQVPPLRSPGFPVELGGVDALHAPFPYRKAHTWSCTVQRGRKFGYAPVGMTLLFWSERISRRFGRDDSSDLVGKNFQDKSSTALR